MLLKQGPTADPHNHTERFVVIAAFYRVSPGASAEIHSPEPVQKRRNLFSCHVDPTRSLVTMGLLNVSKVKMQLPQGQVAGRIPTL